MKRTIQSLVVSLVVVAAEASGQFEGVVQSRIFTLDDNGAGQNLDMTIWVRRDMIKARTSAAGVGVGSTVIYRRDRKMSWIINEAEKSYFEVSLASGETGDAQRDQAPDRPKVERTKLTNKVLGYPCEKILLRRGESETEIWATNALGDLAARLDSLLGYAEGGVGGGDNELLRQLHLYPLVSVTRYEGKVVDSQEVTKIERRPLGVDLFTIPAEYKKQSSLEPVE
jgi:hypothetical protein